MNNHAVDYYSFDQYRFSPSKKILWRDEEIVSISPIALDVLAILLEKMPEPATRDELLDRVWKDTAVEEANVTVAISNLRKTFASGGASETEFIRTLSKRGYLFAANVETVYVAGETAAGIPKAVDTATPRPSKPISRLFVLPLILGAILVSSFSFWYAYGDGTELSSIPVKDRKYGSIAILPLKEIEGKNTALSLGVTDNLISRLGKLKKFAVRPLSAVETFPKSGKDALAFGRDLKVDAVFVGTIQHIDGQLRITVRLLDTRDGTQIWTGKFDETEEDIFDLQDKLSLSFAKNLISELGADDNSKLTKSETGNLDAFRAYNTGKFYLAKRTVDNTKKAITHFEKATNLDPDFAAAYSSLATSYLLLTDSAQGGSIANVEGAKIEAAIGKAIALDPESYEAYAARGGYNISFNWDVAASQKNYDRSIEINPNAALTRNWKAWALMAEGKLDEADEEMKLAKSLDPSSQIIASDAGLPKLYAGKFEEAEPLFREALEMDKNFYQARFRMAYFYYYSGRFAEALKEANALRALPQDDKSFSDGIYAMCLAKTGQVPEAEKIFEDLETKHGKNEQISSILLSSVATALNRKERARHWLEKAVRDRHDFVLYLETAPEYRTLQKEDWFKELVEKVRSRSKF